MYSLSHLATVFFLLGIVSLPTSVHADLGPAETEMKTSAFDAWCGKRGAITVKLVLRVIACL